MLPRLVRVILTNSARAETDLVRELVDGGLLERDLVLTASEFLVAPTDLGLLHIELDGQ